MRKRRAKAMSDSGHLTYSKADVREEWEAILAARRRLAEMEADFAFNAQFLRRKGRADWIPADAAVLLTRASQTTTGHTGGAGGRRGKAPAERGTWTSEIMLVLANHPEGISSQGIREALARTEFGDRFARNPNGFYNATQKLEAAGDLGKYHGHYFTKPLMEEFIARVQRGEVSDLPDVSAGRGREGPTILDKLEEYVERHPEGVAARDISKAMEAEGMSQGTVHNNLSKAVLKDRIRRDGKLYFPSKRNEPPR